MAFLALMQQIIFLKWTDTFFWLFWPWCSCLAPAREPPFLPLWEQIDKCGDCAELYWGESCTCCGVLLCSAYRASTKQPQKHSWLHTNRSGTKRGRGGKLIWCNQSVFSTSRAALLNSAPLPKTCSTNKQSTKRSNVFKSLSSFWRDNFTSDSCQKSDSEWPEKRW